jgi:hypothetical protein
MKQEQRNFDEHLVQDIMKGIRKAVSNLVSETATRNGSLVVERDGKVAHIPAKQLLQELKDKK